MFEKITRKLFITSIAVFVCFVAGDLCRRYIDRMVREETYSHSLGIIEANARHAEDLLRK